MDGDRDRLRARPPGDRGPRPTPGTFELHDGAVLQIPRSALAAPAPLVVLFHGAGSSAVAGLHLLSDLAEEAALVLLAAQSLGQTWDGVRGRFGPDVARLDRVLADAFARCAIDPGRIALGGFSDGASYALSLGLANGDLVSRVVAFSPGFAAPPAQRGRPRIFVSHGTDDPVLPIGRCSRRMVPMLREAGYDVDYEEFDGGHVVRPETARSAVAWLRSGG